MNITRYFTGKPCSRGHVAERYKCNNKCYECARIERKARRLDNPAKNVKRVAKWRVNNPDKYKDQNKRAYRLRGKSALRMWARLNPMQTKTRLRNYRARKHAAKGVHSSQDITDLYRLQHGRCLCGFKFESYHVDHKVPLSRGGSNWPRNLQLLCAPCNGSKGAKTMREWRRSL